MIVLNPFLDSLCNLGFKNIRLTPGIPKTCFQNPQDVVIYVLCVKALTNIFPDEKDYKKDLDVCMFNELEQRLQTGSNNVDTLCHIITDQVSKIDHIFDNFGNFAINIWCPILSENLLKLILPMLDNIIHSGSDWSEDLLTAFKNLSKLNHNHCNDKFSGFQVK